MKDFSAVLKGVNIGAGGGRLVVYNPHWPLKQNKSGPERVYTSFHIHK